jgi:deazaflavin-dependent oxidoreductase (nitroreductase family)
MSDSAKRQAAAAAELSSHRRLLRTGRDGRILSALMLPLLRWAPGRGYGVLTTTGRKTGKRRRKCVRVIQNGDRAYLVALRPPHITVDHPNQVNAWVWNIRAHPAVRLTIRGGTFDGTAREITDPAESELARSLLCDNVYPTDYGECSLHMRGLPSRAKIQELHRYWFATGTPVAIDLTTAN